MNFIKKIFNKGKIECPRCMGKGLVNFDDIKRLKKELKWLPGKCAYCNGKGKVNSKLLSKVSVDCTYLTINRSKEEQKRIINNDYDIMQKARLYENQIDDFIKQVEFLHFEANLTPNTIADFYFLAELDVTSSVKKDMIEYIEKIIKHKKE